jgi:hypothetical protein
VEWKSTKNNAVIFIVASSPSWLLDCFSEQVSKLVLSFSLLLQYNRNYCIANVMKMDALQYSSSQCMARVQLFSGATMNFEWVMEQEGIDPNIVKDL